MKYKSLLITTILLTVVTIAFYYSEVNPVIENNKNTNNFSTSTLSINLETDAGSGIYEEATNSLWPSKGYTFNAELSKCENGSELSWDEENKKVIVLSNKSDKCYIYFDKEIIYLYNYIKSLYSTQGASNLYHHDGTLANGINDGSYRYAGSYETTNNWVCFGTDAEKCDDEHLYRIIGVFNDQVKLIKAFEGTEESLGTAPHDIVSKNLAYYYKGKLDSIPAYRWSESSNDWTTSTLNINILNGTYLTTLGTAWTDKIAMTEWKIGSNTYNNIVEVTAALAYQNEIIAPSTNKTTNSKVGLMYASDYGLAASPANWTTKLYNYGNDINQNNNWLFLGMLREWTISPRVDGSTVAYCVYYDGSLVSNYAVNFTFGVHPTFYLNSGVAFAGGSGTESDPYRIA